MLNRRDVLKMGIASVLSGTGFQLSAIGFQSNQKSQHQETRTVDSVPIQDGVPQVDYHVHIGDEVSVERAIDVAKRRRMKFGLLQHAGVKGHGYAVSDDETLNTWVQSLAGKPVFKGIEAESVDWMSAFSPQALAGLDYVQADCLGLPDKSGDPMQIWKSGFRPNDPQEFMDRYVDFHVQRISTESIDILVMPTYLPDSLLPDYDRLWTEGRMRRIVDAAAKRRVALEIDCRFRVPRQSFLEMAKAAGVKFAFGSNYQTLAGIGDISYCVEMYKRLGLTPQEMFWPRRVAPGMGVAHPAFGQCEQIQIGRRL